MSKLPTSAKAVFPVVLALFISVAPSPAAPAQAQKPPAQAAAPPAFAENDEIPLDLRQKTFDCVWETIRDKYFDTAFGGVDWAAVGNAYRPKVDETKESGAFHGLLKQMLKELGGSHLAIIAPHEMTRERKAEPEQRTAPEGVEVRFVEGRIGVVAVAPDSPAWAAGLRPGHFLLKIDGADVPKTLAEVRRALAGPPQSTATLTVLDGSDREQALAVPRTAPYQDRANLARTRLEYRRITPRVGYIRFDGWGFDLKPKLEAALNDLWASDALIIDLRQNRGGVNPGVDYLASVLLPGSGLLAVATLRSGVRSDWPFSAGDRHWPGKLAILVDEASGSASEVFAGAMQEMGRAVVLGRTSYGGVLNSTQAPLPTGGVLQYPHSDMRTPKGRRIEGVGVVPDVPVELRREDLLEGVDTLIERAVQEILSDKK